MPETKNTELIQKVTTELFKLLEVEAKIIIEETEENLKINAETPNPGLLIGFHGETLSALGLILSLVIYKKTKKWTRIQVNVGDYRERREEQLRQMLERIVSQVKTTGQPHALPPLPSNERRLIHLMVQNDSDVLSESEGDGPNRRVIIKPKDNE